MVDLITVERYDFAKDWTVGRLLLRDARFGFVMEDEIRVKKIRGETAIPFGRFRLGHRHSPKFSKWFLWSEKAQTLIPNPKTNRKYRETAAKKVVYDRLLAMFDDWEEHRLIWILDVPDFEFVLIHWGNTDRETDGCLLVGSVLGMIEGREAVLHSLAHYMDLYPKIFPLVKKGNEYINIIKAA